MAITQSLDQLSGSFVGTDDNDVFSATSGGTVSGSIEAGGGDDIIIGNNTSADGTGIDGTSISTNWLIAQSLKLLFN